MTRWRRKGDSNPRSPVSGPIVVDSPSGSDQIFGILRRRRTRLLVASDIAARGFDLEGVSHLINFELSNVPDDDVMPNLSNARAGDGR